MRRQVGELSTLDDLDRRESAVAVWGRRALVTALALLVLAGLLGLLGVRTTTTTAAGNGYRLSLEHASIARSGLDVPFEITVVTEGQFADQLTIALTGDYFDIYETQGFTPEPTESSRDGRILYLTFDTPDGNTMVVDYDAYIQPASQQGRSGTVGVVSTEGVVLVSVAFRTRVLP